ncbi:hypothetical protein [Streptomyces sp. NPDC046979]|uniref:hypothetical protein n=1 Tax=Streptomyces sp. NPDC046979 TaxID=3154604 RepID=UPI0033F052D6
MSEPASDQHQSPAVDGYLAGPQGTDPAPPAVPDGPPPATASPPAPAGPESFPDHAALRPERAESYAEWRSLLRIGTNNGFAIGTLIQQSINRLRGIPLTRKEIDDCLRPYVPQPDDETATTKILDDRRVVVLTGSDGSGRFTTALQMLRSRVGDNIRQVSREPKAPFDVAGLTEKRTGWILDLRAETPHTGFGRELKHDSDELPEGSFLVVLMSATAWTKCGKNTEGLAHEIAGPPPAEVLAKLLEPAPLLIDHGTWTGHPDITGGIKGLRPGQVAAWAGAIVTTEELERDAGRLTTATADDRNYTDRLVGSVVKAAENWRRMLLAWHNKYQDSDYRNFLLAAAVLEGATSQSVYEASADLAADFDEDPAPRPGQKGLGVIALADAADADLLPDGTIRFRHHNKAEAVVDYFLDDRPHLLKQFTTWTAAQVGSLEDAQASRLLAQRVSHWTVRYTARHRTVRLLKELSEQWSTTQQQAACDMLVLAALDDHAGSLVRGALRRWARGEAGTLSDPFTIVIVRACRRLIDVHPASMLNRLTELASSTVTADGARSGDVTETISQTLNTLWDRDGQRRAIRRQLSQWADATNRSQQRAARDTFAHLAQRRGPTGPSLLTDTDRDLTWVASMWRNALPTHGEPPLSVVEAFGYWMQAALDHPSLTDTTEQVFRQAVHADRDPYYSGSRLVAMQKLLFSWAPTPPPAHQVGEAVHLRDRYLAALQEQDPATSPEPHAPQS